MKHITPLNKTHDLLRRMGGFAAIGKKMTAVTGIKLTKQAVHWWVTRDRIPKMWKPYLSMAYPQFAPEIHASGDQ